MQKLTGMSQGVGGPLENPVTPYGRIPSISVKSRRRSGTRHAARRAAGAHDVVVGLHAIGSTNPGLGAPDEASSATMAVRVPSSSLVCARQIVP